MFRVSTHPHYLGPTANPYQDADNWIADQEDAYEWAVNHSHLCKNCGEPTYEVNTNEWYEIDEDAYCADCAEKYKFAKIMNKKSRCKCSVCGYETTKGFDVDFFQYDGKVYCDDCILDFIMKCRKGYGYLSDIAANEAYEAYLEGH